MGYICGTCGVHISKKDRYICSTFENCPARPHAFCSDDCKLLDIIPPYNPFQLLRDRPAPTGDDYLKLIRTVATRLKHRKYELVSYIAHGTGKVVFRVTKKGKDFAAKLAYNSPNPGVDYEGRKVQTLVGMHYNELKCHRKLGRDCVLFAWDKIIIPGNRRIVQQENQWKHVTFVEIQELVEVGTDLYDKADANGRE